MGLPITCLLSAYLIFPQRTPFITHNKLLSLYFCSWHILYNKLVIFGYKELQPSRSNQASDLKCESKLTISKLEKVKVLLPVLFKCKNIHYTNINVRTQQREKTEGTKVCQSKIQRWHHWRINGAQMKIKKPENLIQRSHLELDNTLYHSRR